MEHKENNTYIQSIFIVFTIIVILISSTLTFSFFLEFLPNFLPMELVGKEISQIFSGLFGLLVFDIGSLVWLYVYLKLAENDSQRTTSMFASLIDFAGSLITSFTYLIITGQKLYALSEGLRSNIGFVALISIAFVMVYNFFSIWVYKKNSDESLKDIDEGRRRQRLQNLFKAREAILDKDIEKLVRDEYNRRKPEIAKMIAEKTINKKIEEELGRAGIGTDGMFSADTRQESPKL